MQFPKELSPQVLPMPRQSERGTARGTEAGSCFALLGRLGAKKCHECDKCQARKLSSWLSPSMPAVRPDYIRAITNASLRAILVARQYWVRTVGTGITNDQFWHIALIRGDAAIRSLSERSGH